MSRVSNVFPWHSIHDIDLSNQTEVDRLNTKISVFKALDAGVANSGQQKAALTLIIEDLAGTYDLSFRPGLDGARATDFAEGKRHVGSQIVRFLNRSPAVYTPKKK